MTGYSELSRSWDLVSAASVFSEPETIVDIGTGCGNIAISLAKELPQARIFATDNSRKALTVARLNSSRRVTWPNATSVLVTVVPMFAPMMIGMALPAVITWLATMPITIEVVVDEDCIMLVARMPMNRPIIQRASLGQCFQINTPRRTAAPPLMNIQILLNACRSQLQLQANHPVTGSRPPITLW